MVQNKLNDVKEKGKITKHTIKHDDTTLFSFLGIVTAEPDYRLCVMLNKQLGISLHHDMNDLVDMKEKEASHYSVFTTSPLTVSLIANKCRGNYLLRKLKNIDYLLLLHGAADRQKAELLASDIRKSNYVTAVFVFESSDIKDKNLSLLLL